MAFLAVFHSLTSFAVDVWSLGCVMGEMLLHGPMFGGGVYSDEIELYLDIVTKIGPPKEEWFNGLEPSVKRYIVYTLH